MAAVKKVSHPTFAHGFVDILEELFPVISNGSQYGFYGCTGAFAVSGLSGENPRDIPVKVVANTSQANALSADRLYVASLRLVKSEITNTFAAYYTPKHLTVFGPSDGAPDIVNRLTMSGLGIVVSREETFLPNSGDPVLFTEIRHTDWDTESRKTVSFSVIYATLRKGNLANSFGLFQVGRELSLSGIIVDWDDCKNTWIVQTATISVTSGHQSLTVPQTIPNKEAARATGRKRTLAKISCDLPNKDVVSTSREGGSQSVVPGEHDGTLIGTSNNTSIGSSIGSAIETSPEIMHPPISVPHTLEVQTDKKDSPVFQNSYVKKRTQQEVLSDARKRNKGNL